MTQKRHIRPAIDREPERVGNRGAALVLALSLIVIFSVLGTVYVNYMNMELTETDMGVRETRATYLAEAGVNVAIEGLRMKMLRPNLDRRMGEPVTFDFTTYDRIIHGDTGIFTEPLNVPRIATATVIMYDESSRVDINRAPAAVLQRLGIEGSAASEIVRMAAQEPFLALDELVTRGALSQEQFDALDRARLTVYSAGSGAGRGGYVNVNEAAPAVLQAVLGINEAQAAQIRKHIEENGPFSSLPSFGATVATITGAPAADIEANPALALKSRCFRVVSESRYAKILDRARYEAASEADRDRFLHNRASDRVEAVLQFNDDGSYSVLHWIAGKDASGASAA